MNDTSGDLVDGALFVTDSGGVLPLDTHNNAHVFDSSDGVALCGHSSTASHDRELVGEASHEHTVVGDHRVCGNCARAVRSRIASGELSSGDETLDLMLRSEAGDELRIGVADEAQHMTVDSAGWRFGRAVVEGREVDPATETVEYYTDHVEARRKPNGETEVRLAGDLLDDRTHDSGSVSRPVAADGGTRPASSDELTDEENALLGDLDEVPAAWRLDDEPGEGESYDKNGKIRSVPPGVPNTPDDEENTNGRPEPSRSEPADFGGGETTGVQDL